MGTVHYLPSLKPSKAPPHIVAAAIADAPPPPIAPAMNVHERRFMSTVELAGRLGLDHHAQRTIVDKLRALHRQCGLPLPRNPRIVNGAVKLGAAAICWASLWDRGEALKWLEHGSTPPPALAADPPRARQQLTRERLADRAAAQLMADRKRRVGE